ncbi:MAG TPA: type II secretion system F family protein [bacterium]|nr:type II secretion system F family protein [bacterium]
MVQFHYRALQADGTLADGQVEAQGRQDAFNQLLARGWKPVRISELNREASVQQHWFRLPWRNGKVSFKELENFTRLLANLLASGIPLSRSLGLLHREAGNPTATEKWKAIHDRVIDGTTLADSMAMFPDIFPRVYIAMVQAGETGGFLDLVLSQIAEFQSRERDLRSKVMSALIYPSVLLVLAISVLIFLLVFFIPRFQAMFKSFGAELPLITQAIVGTSALIRNWGPFVVVLVALMAYFVRQWFSTDRGMRIRESILLRLPMIGPLLARFAMARFCRMLGTLLASGVPLIQGLNVARKSIPNRILSDAVSDGIERVKKGDRLSGSFSSCSQLFSNAVLEMISVAEETGRLDKELIRIAETTEQELERQLRTAVALTEPLMLFLIAGFIGTIFIGMVIPIFTIQDYIK